MEGTRAWCNRIIEGLIAAGVSDLVVSPGSRSTPFLLAALRSSLQLHSVVDERSAAFFALGRTRKTGTPTALLCTSGSAGAHYLPALLEARYAGHRLIALTADRPPQLRDCGANQTIDQRQLFAAACPPCLELGMPDRNAQALDAVRRRVFESVSLATGPVHFNLAFRKPLEPNSDEKGQGCEPFSPQTLRRPEVRAHQEALFSVQQECEKSKTIVIIAGPSEYGIGDSELLASELALLATLTGAALLAESTSGARFVGVAHPHRFDSFTHILNQDKATQELAPDLILQFGLQPSSASLNRWLAEQKCTTLRLCDSVPYNSPDGSAQVIIGNLVDLCRRLRGLVPPSSDAGYIARWRGWDELAQEAVDAEIAETASEFSEAQVMDAFLGYLPTACQVTIGNSLAIRTADMVLAGSKKRLQFLHQRGTSGIEGLIAGA
ncbi:MAG: 2-succinyl-5-enolpyruvyl-6-hydroxy-3-cyclohexene-1-carboxylic-acid synthase, partial [Kofleriaceae bacterium]|nr:2-succinyl-5-enolpyruvyl-6-hydroxy-3-cyclohexene-1-carboxylic-acid synthase [Kofleriaceae bacterium]